MYYSSLEPELWLHYGGLWLGVKAWRTVCWGVVGLLVGRPVVIVEVVLSVSAVPVVPLQLETQLSISSQSSTPPHLGFEGMVLLGEVLLPVVVGVAPPVSPLEDLVGGDVNVLEVVLGPVAALPGYGERSLTRSLGPGVGGDTGHQSDQN